jgi:hypothetical protein
MFTGYGKIYIIGDNDLKDDGTNPGAEFSRMVAQEVLNSTIVSLPTGMDLNDSILSKGYRRVKTDNWGTKCMKSLPLMAVLEWSVR